MTDTTPPRPPRTGAEGAAALQAEHREPPPAALRVEEAWALLQRDYYSVGSEARRTGMEVAIHRHRIEAALQAAPEPSGDPPEMPISGVVLRAQEDHSDDYEDAKDAPAAVSQDRTGRLRGRLPLPELRPETPTDPERVVAPHGATDRTPQPALVIAEPPGDALRAGVRERMETALLALYRSRDVFDGFDKRAVEAAHRDVDDLLAALRAAGSLDEAWGAVEAAKTHGGWTISLTHNPSGRWTATAFSRLHGRVHRKLTEARYPSGETALQALAHALGGHDDTPD